MFEICSSLLALVLLASIAYPQLFIPQNKKKKKVGSAYWGVYQGSELTDSPSEAKIECPRPARRWIPIAGSGMYASGKGTSLRR
jgi:hypothetical protein